jgi:ComF family protein
MPQKLKNYFNLFFDFVAPRRSDAVVVDKINSETLQKLPRAPESEGLPWIHSLFHYKDNRVRAIIWELKYKENLHPLPLIGQILYDEIIALVSDIVLFDNEAKFLLVPIPISVERRIERGFNQSEHIAKSILPFDSERILLYAPQWLQKMKDTPSQSHTVSRAQRLQNLSGCFSADPRVSGSYVILIDDVTTTGATLSEARTTLLAAGARDCFAFTIAH